MKSKSRTPYSNFLQDCMRAIIIVKYVDFFLRNLSIRKFQTKKKKQHFVALNATRWMSKRKNMQSTFLILTCFAYISDCASVSS